jgi:hypothetical protein
MGYGDESILQLIFGWHSGLPLVIRLLNPTALSSAEKLFVCAAVALSG